MYFIDIKRNKIWLKTLELNNLSRVLKWYNEIDQFKFATGFDRKVSLEEIIENYNQTNLLEKYFFLGIFSSELYEMVGVIKGFIKNFNTIWINLILIDQDNRNKGYGRESIELLLEYFKMNHNIKNAYLSVVEENKIGLSFWSKLGFNKIDEVISKKNLKKIVIMYKIIK